MLTHLVLLLPHSALFPPLLLSLPQEPLSFKGVVFNEMKGVYSSPDSLFYRTVQNALFPDNTYRWGRAWGVRGGRGRTGRVGRGGCAVSCGGHGVWSGAGATCR